MEVIKFEDLEKFNKQPVLSIGMFDGVHKGHSLLIEQLKQEALRLNTCSMVITFDQHPRQAITKNENEVSILQTTEERFKHISKSGVDYLVVLHFTKEIAMLEASNFLDLVIEKINPAEMLITLLGQTIRPSEEENMDKLLDLLGKMLDKVDLYKLGCNISREAAELSFNTMSKGDR